MLQIVVIVYRLVIPFTILRFPFWGALAAILADASDIMLFEAFGFGFFGNGNYHTIDKILDIYYLVFLVLASRKWEEVFAKRLVRGLFLWRLCGVAAFEFFRWRGIFLLAPNIVENFYLGVVFFHQFFPKTHFTRGRLLALLVIASIPKIIQEYIMHYLEFPTWLWLKTHFFFWLYKS